LNNAQIVCADLSAAIDEWQSKGFRLDLIYPADEPHSALVSRDGERVLLTSQPGAERPSSALPPFAPDFLLTRGGAPGKGRAGMFYRDLIPGRLGGRYIASHITIPKGGPVADWVHFHRVALQMIYVRSGWVRVVYEDQGEPFVMNPGDLVLQPPQIRHRVLESSPGLEVIEISAPALHETFADHEMELPNGRPDPDRSFNGQRFQRHVASEAPWAEFHGAEAQLICIDGLAEVRTLRRSAASLIDFPGHKGELVFGFVLKGNAKLDFAGSHELASGDAFIIPPREGWSLADASTDFALLQVTVPSLSRDCISS